MRHAWTLAALAAGGLLAAGAAAPAAIAADDCPNAAVRAQQQSQHLPNCMAFEKVTPDDTGGAPPRAPGAPVVGLSEDGTRVLMTLVAASDEAQSFPASDWRRSSRGDRGWTATSLLPPMNEPRLVSGIDGTEVVASSADLERVLMSTGFPLAPQDRGEMLPGLGSKDLYLRDPDGTLTWLVPDPDVPDTSTASVTLVGASPDLERVALRTSRPFDPRVTPTWEEYAYVWSREHGMQLATVLPDGSPVPAGNVAVSDDGRRVVFGAGGKFYVRFDADDPGRAVTREVAVGRNSGEICNSPALVQYGQDNRWSLSRDGTQVLFYCNGAMWPGGPNVGSSVPYIRDLDGGPAAVRQFEHFWVVVEAADDFSWFYTRVSPTVVDSTNSRGFVLGRDGTSRPAVPPAVVPGTATNVNTVASADGEFLAFESGGDFALPGVDPGPPNRAQVYLYSAVRDELRCVSCRPDGAPTVSAGRLSAGEPRITAGGSLPVTVSDRGVVTFTTASALVPEDTNGVEDAYAWIDGRPVLLSGGRSGDPSLALGMTRDGRSFLLTTPDALAVDDRDGGYDLYLARENGGWLVSEPPASCTSNCQAPGAERPGVPVVGTGNVLPNGNLVESVAPKRASATLTTSRSVRGTSTTVRVKVSRAGSIRVSGNGLRQATVKAKKAGTYRVTVRLSAHGAQQQRSRGRLVTQVTARFTPKSGASASARKPVTFTRATTKKGGR